MTHPDPRPAASASADALAALRSWFASGHSRFAMRLRGALDGQVLVASDQGPGSPPALIARSVASTPEGIVTERKERPIAIEDVASDPVDGPALVEACKARLQGRVDPPHICPTARSDKFAR